MLKPNEIEAFSMLLDEQMKKLEMRVMSDIVRRIKVSGEITSSADRQIRRLHELGTSKRDIRKYIKDSLQLSTQEINHLYRDVIRKGYALSESLYKHKGRPFIPFEENLGLQQLISSAAMQTSGTMRNITQSLGFAVRQTGGQLKFVGLADYYQKTLDSAILDISSGAFDYNTVLKRIVGEMTDSGLRSVDYASGRSNRVDVAARRAVMTGMSQLTAKINDDNAKALDTDMFEVTWHSGARPEHQVWQGKWYTRKQLEEICGLGTVTGLCGANCYHDYYPVIPGVSEPTYTEEELAELNRRDNAPVEYNGKKYTKYEALQRQRRLETTMRAQRQKIKLLEDGGANEEDIINARARYRASSAEYARFSKTMELPQQRERVTVDGLGNIGAGKYMSDPGKTAAVKSGGGTSSSGNAAEINVQAPSENGGTGKLYEPEKIPGKAVDNPGESGIIESYRGNSINIVGSNGISSETTERIRRAAETVTDDFPVLSEHIENINFGDADGAVAINSYSPLTGENGITFSETAFSDPAHLQEALADDFARGWSYETNHIESLVAHEMGHAAHISLALKRAGLKYGKPLSDIERHIFEQEYRKIAQEVYLAAFTTESYDEIQALCVKQLGGMVYADSHELIAQSFGNYYYGENKSKIAGYIVEFFKKELN